MLLDPLEGSQVCVHVAVCFAVCVAVPPVVSSGNDVATVAGRLGQGVAAIGDVSPLVPVAYFAAAGCATLGSDARHGAKHTAYIYIDSSQFRRG